MPALPPFPLLLVPLCLSLRTRLCITRARLASTSPRWTAPPRRMVARTGRRSKRSGLPLTVDRRSGTWQVCALLHLQAHDLESFGLTSEHSHILCHHSFVHRPRRVPPPRGATRYPQPRLSTPVLHRLRADQGHWWWFQGPVAYDQDPGTRQIHRPWVHCQHLQQLQLIHGSWTKGCDVLDVISCSGVLVRRCMHGRLFILYFIGRTNVDTNNHVFLQSSHLLAQCISTALS